MSFPYPYLFAGSLFLLPCPPGDWCSPDFVDTVKSHAALCRAARSNSAGLR